MKGLLRHSSHDTSRGFLQYFVEWFVFRGVDELASAVPMTEQDRQISKVFAEQGSRLRNFIRRRVPDREDAEDILQDVFYRLVEANRLLMPIDHLTGWLYQVARNRITDVFRKKKPEPLGEVEGEDGEMLSIEDLLPSPDAGPEAEYLRGALMEEMEAAIAELPAEQRAVFVANELEGKTFREISEQSGVNLNTLLARKRAAVLRLRERLEEIHEEFSNE
jgi:RNA polymerase sigma factor (sigma-70 family)